MSGINVMSKRIFACVLLVFFIFSSFSFQAHADEKELATVQAAIRANGARWQARETSRSRLSLAQRKRSLGKVDVKMTAQRLAASGIPQAAVRKTATALPSSLDYRKAGYVSAIKDQGNCGSCWAFGATATLESNALMAGKTEWSNLSEQVLLSCNTSKDSCENGGMSETGGKFFVQYGLPVESCYKYTAKDGTCSSACSNWKNSTYKITSWTWITQGKLTSSSVEAIKNALYTYGPLQSAYEVYSDFENYSSGVYEYTSGQYEGGHIIQIVGYDDSKSAFIVKNSWGTDWGESGYFYIGYSQVTNKVKFGEETIAMTGATCSNSISPTSASVEAAGGTGSITLTTQTGCTWKATSNDSFITITSGSSGTGSGTVAYSVAANTTTSSRTGTITAGDKTFTITQAAKAASCAYTTSPTSATIDVAGGAGSVDVTTTSGCEWKAASNVSYASVTSGSSGTGSGTVAYSVTANTGTSSRTGTLTIGGKTFTFTQSAPSCAYSISPTSASIEASGGTGSVSVTTTSGCAWTAKSNDSYASITSGSSGTGSGTVAYSVSANSDSSSRTGTLTIAGQTFTITQAANSSCTYKISPTSATIDVGGGSGTVSVTTQTGCVWVATSSSSFASISSGAGGTGSGNVAYTVTENTDGATRTGVLVIAGQTFAITQAAGSSTTCTYEISPTSTTAAAAGQSMTAQVKATSGCAWTAASSVDWATISWGSTGTGSATVGITVAANTTGESRTGTVVIADQTLTITQPAGDEDTSDCTYTVMPKKVVLNRFHRDWWNFTRNQVGLIWLRGSDKTCKWKASSNADWLTVTPATGTGRGVIHVTATQNATGASRTATVTVGSQTVSVVQTIDHPQPEMPFWNDWNWYHGR